MKIKYLDKKSAKKINEEAEIMKTTIGIALAFIIPITALISIGASYSKNAHDIMQTQYVTEDKQQYAAENVYLLFNDSEIIECRRESEVITEKNITHYSYLRSKFLGLPIFSNYNIDITQYKFYDIKTNEFVASTYKEYDSFDSESIEDSMNGYNFINLGELLVDSNYNKDIDDTINRDFIDQNIDAINNQIKRR